MLNITKAQVAFKTETLAYLPVFANIKQLINVTANLLVTSDQLGCNNDCYNEVCLKSCYNEVRRNSCYDEAGRKSCNDEAWSYQMLRQSWLYRHTFKNLVSCKCYAIMTFLLRKLTLNTFLYVSIYYCKA